MLLCLCFLLHFCLLMYGIIYAISGIESQFAFNREFRSYLNIPPEARAKSSKANIETQTRNTKGQIDTQNEKEMLVYATS